MGASLDSGDGAAAPAASATQPAALTAAACPNLGQSLECVERVELGVDCDGPLYTHGQCAPAGHLHLDANTCFFGRAGPLTLAGQGQQGLPGSSFNGDKSFAYIGGWSRVGDSVLWGLDFAKAGSVEVVVALAVAEGTEGSRVKVTLGSESVTVDTVATGSSPNAMWRLQFTVAAPGLTDLVFTAETIRHKQGIGCLHHVDITGAAATGARVLRARWRPAAVHCKWHSSSQKGPAQIWAMELETKLSGVDVYSPITTEFGYFGSARSWDGGITGINFSMWSYGQGKEAPAMEELSHLIAVGSPSADLGGFSHEGTGVKVRNWNPYEGLRPLTQMLALRLEPGERYDTFYGYFLDPTTGHWKLFAAGRKFNNGKPLRCLSPGAFVEVAGPPHKNRTGNSCREVKYRGWFCDAEGRWTAVDTQDVMGSNDCINKSWGVRGSQFVMTMGGFLHRQDTKKKRSHYISEPSKLPPCLQSPAVEGLMKIPATFAVRPAESIASDSATACFHADDLGSRPTVTMFWGTSDALTFQDKWQHSCTVEAPVLGLNRVTIAGLSSSTSYVYRVRVCNEEGQTWSLESATVRTT